MLLNDNENIASMVLKNRFGNVLVGDPGNSECRLSAI
jgi:hypothetical protein